MPAQMAYYAKTVKLLKYKITIRIYLQWILLYEATTKAFNEDEELGTKEMYDNSANDFLYPNINNSIDFVKTYQPINNQTYGNH
jgi:hypothetical protein